MKSTLLKYMLYLIFIISIFTGLGDLLGGAAAIPGVKSAIAASVDNELRCLAVFWLAFGAFCFWITRNMTTQSRFIPIIALVILVGGIARLLSIIVVGMPTGALFFAMIIEFVIPIVLYVGYKKALKLQ